MRSSMGRRTARMTTRVFLEAIGGIAILGWLVFAEKDPWSKILFAVAGGLLLVALYLSLGALERRRLRKELAEKVCNVSVVGPPRWNNRPVEEYVLRGPAVKALMAEHNRVARDAESAVRQLGYRRKDAHKAIETGRYEYGLYTYQHLFEFAVDTAIQNPNTTAWATHIASAWSDTDRNYPRHSSLER
jgi:hypothetical protein